MGKVKLPQGLPDSLIIDELVEKSNNKRDSRLNFVFILDDFRSRVSKEVRFIGELFPEYTPHDEEFHLSRLFHLGDKLLGNEVISNLNSTELFILSAAIYGHDWGMAVSKVERDLIHTQEIQDGFKKEEYALIENEHTRFKKHLESETSYTTNKLSLSNWQEYVRLTHSERSGERVRKFFNTVDSGIGEAIARVCEAHWLDFRDLQDTNSYPTNYAVSNDTVNLRALAVYLRLIDLLDITQDRTPYIIWKYVAPRNLRSEMEWNKHKAIYSISFPSYQDGRIVQVDGGTNNHEVYAALVDLRNFCNEQLRGCNDILTHINDSRYNLNLFHIDWRIQARNFSPISVQFEFDRMRMFEVLSEEIYQGDRYVFLRELLQNSIDAIGVRRAILEKKGLSASQIGLIEVKVHHLENGSCEISFTDDGVGMDEFIVKNYLSVAGKSYYNSEDFKKLGIIMDPISKFGVGVLSCFMVADQIDIETHKDPYAIGKSEVLIIQIYSIHQQFRIQSFTNSDFKVGTTFKLYVKGEKLRSKIRGNAVDKLNVTEYLATIAGFVKIPIKVIEDDLNTLILHPSEDASEYQKKYPTFEVRQLDLGYPWNAVFLPQSVKGAKELLRENSIDVSKDLSLSKVAEGRISFLDPIDEGVTLTNIGNSWPGSDFMFKTKGGDISKRIQFSSDWVSYGHRIEQDESKYGKSATHQQQFRIYLDGILVPGAKPPRSLYSTPYDRNVDYDYFHSIPFSDDRFSLPFTILNFKRNALSGIDLSRTEIIDNERHWEDVIKDEFFGYMNKKYLTDLLLLDKQSRLFQISNCILFHHIPAKVMMNFIPESKWPVPIITKDGALEVKELEDYLDKTIYFEPSDFNHFYKLLLEKVDQYKERTKSPFDIWRGGEFILLNLDDNSDSRKSWSNHSALMLSSVFFVINKTHFFSSFRFLNSCWLESPPLIQSVWTPLKERALKENPNPIDLLSKASRTVTTLTYEEFQVILKYYSEHRHKIRVDIAMPYIGKFEQPYQNRLSYGFRILNFEHMNTKNLIGVFCLILLAKNKHDFTDAIINELIDKFRHLAYFDYSSEYEGASIKDINKAINDIANFATNELSYPHFIAEEVTFQSFVDRSVFQNEKKYISSSKIGKRKGFHVNPNYSIPL